MMGVKTRVFQPMVNVSLEDLVPADHFYRHVERPLDLSFVRDLVRDRSSVFGRPSSDPVVVFKLQLVMFFEGIRSERQLQYVGSDRLTCDNQCLLECILRYKMHYHIDKCISLRYTLCHRRLYDS
jgi:hypothetical protein